MTGQKTARTATGVTARAAGTVPATRLQTLLAAAADVLTCAHDQTSDTRVTPARARFAVTGHSDTVPVGVERERLRAGLGAVLRAARAEAGMSQWVLACRAGVARSTVERLEGGVLRPTPSMLAGLVLGLGRRFPPVRVDGAAEVALLGRLLDAAGPSVVVDTLGGLQRRERRVREAEVAYRRQLRRQAEAAAAAHRERDRESRAALRRLRRASPAETVRLLELLVPPKGPRR